MAPSSLAATSAIDGLWGGERVFAPAAPFVVRVTAVAADAAERPPFVAHALGTSVPFAGGAETRFDLPRNLGSFRGTQSADGTRFEGHWITPPGPLAYSHYAQPLTLRRVAPGIWRGAVTPFPQRFRLYLDVAEGGRRVVFINPERNEGRYHRIAKLAVTPSEVRFEDADGGLVARGRFDATEDRLRLTLPRRGGTYDLRRLTRDAATGFYPRPDGAYRYAAPPALADGWPVANANDAGLDRERLARLVQQIVDTRPESIRTPRIHSLLVAYRGALVVEEYFHGYDRDHAHDLRSASKSLTGLMVGQAVAEQADLRLSTTLPVLFADARLADDARRDISLEHLLSMRSGLACDDNDGASPGNEDRMQSQTRQPDWYRYTLSLPMAAAPGARGVYCSAGINLLGGAVSAATDTWLPEFFRTRLAEPLGIDTYYMNLDPLRRGYAGGGLHLRPRDALKFAQLMVDAGRWAGRQVVSESWVARAARPWASVNEADDYGLTWWRGALPYGERTVQALSATGNGGQLLIAVPQLDLAVVFNGGNYGDFRTWVRWRDRLLPEHILPAIPDPGPLP